MEPEAASSWSASSPDPAVARLTTLVHDLRTPLTLSLIHI